MKFTTGLVLAAVAVAGATADDSKVQSVDPATLTHLDPSTIAGLGPAVPAGNNPNVKKAMEELAGSGNYLTIDPKSLPTMDPAHIVGLGPALRPGMPGYGQNAQFNKAWAEYLEKEGKQGRALESTTTTFNVPKDPKTIDPALLEGLGPQTPAGDNSKAKKAMKELTDGSSNHYTIDPKSLPTQDPSTLQGLGPQTHGTTTTFNVPKDPKTIDPALLTGLGPMTPAGDNPNMKKSMEQLAGSTDNYYTVDPKTLPTQDPSTIQGLGPQTHGRALESTTTTFNVPKDPKTIDPALIEGLGPMTPAGDNPKVKKAMKELADGSSNTLTIDPKSLPTMDPANISGLGPAVLPGMPGYGKNEKANAAWKEYLQKQGASTSSSGSAASSCAQVCPDVYQPVCGSDGVTYSNSCFLGVASCNNPEKHITKASDDACSGQATLD